ncbi:hypothetical protein GN244_ATG16816 [Phytophthora infestans]|uniref:Uncharacterized protein n=1 Tax=Phytophthora infestans TaxID=4787 RepID=A0A833T003_PHYIN|nr:hypothetical protein GN244_ATG16816 [Phytophthora infestans]KAF4141792.1 hypothetical protein GN958_ATG09037 [Phytophthora infestans]
MSYTLDTFRMDIATYLGDDPTATIRVQMIMSFAQLLVEDIRNACPALFERLKSFVNTIPATAMSINASTEFPRFEIVGVRCDTEAGLCNSRELKQFLSPKNLLFTERRKDRFGAFQECEKVDAIVREQMRQCEIYSEPIAVKCTWIRNRSSDMIFVSPLTLMRAFMDGQNTGEFKRDAGILYMMILIVENKQSSALKSVVSKTDNYYQRIFTRARRADESTRTNA